MSKVLQEKINELFEVTKDLKSFEEIEPYCNQFNEWVSTHTSYSTKSLGTKLSAYGFYKKFKSIPLEQGLNAEAIAKHDENGNVKGHELRHYAVLMCGLDQSDWKQRNEATRVIDFVKENPTDKELQGVATTLGYADYFTTKPVPFPTAPEREKTTSIRINEFDLKPIRKLQQEWELPNQQGVIETAKAVKA
jgi:hypothetical protein